MVLVALLGCGFFASGQDWTEQLEPAGPCYSFNFIDGVDRGESAELHAAFACLNQQGALEPMERADAALDSTTRDHIVVAVAYDLFTSLEAYTAELSAAQVVDSLLEALDDPDGIDATVRLALEWVYAAQVEELGTAVSVNSETSLAAGMVVPLLDVGAAVATSVLDDDLRALAPLAEALRAEESLRLAWSVALLPDAADPALQALAEDWPALAADVLERVQQAENNRHEGATGDSLRDLLSALRPPEVLPAVGAAVEPLLSSSFIRDALADWVLSEDEAGRWTQLDTGLLYLASVNAAGGSVNEGEDSALVSLIRLLRNTNQSLDCEVDVGFVTWEFSLGNLAVALLEALAQIDPETATSGVDLLGNALGYPLTEAVLDTVANTGVCPGIDAQLVSDLGAIDRLTDPTSEPLLLTLLALLRASDDEIGSIANLATALHNHDLVEPVEELLFDLAGSSTANSLLAAVPAFMDPDGRQASEAFPAGLRPVDVHVVATVILAVTDADTVSTLSPIVDPILARPATWVARDNLEVLLTRSNTETSALLPRLRPLLEADPEGEAFATTANLLSDPAVTRPMLVLIESSAVRDAITDTSLTEPGPLPWLAQLHLSGTLTRLVNTLSSLRAMLGGSDA